MARQVQKTRDGPEQTKCIMTWLATASQECKAPHTQARARARVRGNKDKDGPSRRKMFLGPGKD